MFVSNTKVLYQIGDPFNDKVPAFMPSLVDSSNTIVKATKLRNSESNFIDGFIDNYKFTKSKLSGWSLDISFLRDDKKVSWNQLQMLKRDKLKIFFVEEQQNGGYKVYYLYGRYTSGLDDIYNSRGGLESGSREVQANIPVSFQVEKPFYYLCDSDLVLLKHDVTGDFITYGDSSLTYGDGSVDYGVSNPGYEIDFYSLSASEQRELINFENPKYNFTFKDKFIKANPLPESVSINTDNSFSTTLTNNNKIITNSNNLDLSTPEESFFNLIKLDIFGGFATNEWVEIINTDTKTGFRFTWLATANSPSSLLINTAQTSSKVTNPALRVVVNEFDSNNNRNYSMLATDLSNLYLSFTNRFLADNIATNVNLSLAKSDKITLQKNTSANLTITIKNLLTFS